MISQMDPSNFDWLSWRNGDIWHEFRIPCRTAALVSNRLTLQKYAIGWCKGENLVCRPKEGHIAIMFFKDEKQFWFHLRDQEFQQIFQDDNDHTFNSRTVQKTSICS